MEITFIQSADAVRYAPMLAVTSANVAAYCERQGFAYEAFLGIRRGCWPWHAAYNRLFQMQDLVDRGFRGWIVHLDADAWVADPEFDLRAYLSERDGHCCIMAEAGGSGKAWDINNGVMLVNCRLEGGRRLIRRWLDAFLAMPDAMLAAATDWLEGGNDQDLLQKILRADPALAAGVLVESKDLLNSRRARFIRQHVRADTTNLARRIANIAAEVADVADGGAKAGTTIFDDRALYRLRRPNSHDVRLVESPPGPGDPSAARAALERWTDVARAAGAAPRREPLAQALAGGDPAAVDDILRHFGRSPAAAGLLGGPRQHERAAADAHFARMRALRTKDALAALAEACGALDVENPDHGLWGFNVQMPADAILDRIATTMQADLSPPTALGCHLGIAVGDRVLHLRMVEALHTAWRALQVQRLLKLDGVVDLDGGLGFRAFYAARLALARYRIDERDPCMAAIQSYVLSGQPPAASSPEHYLLLNEETLPETDPEALLSRLSAHHRAGAKALLSINHEAHPDTGRQRPSARQLLLSTDLFELVQRTPHAVRQGFVEELYLSI